MLRDGRRREACSAKIRLQQDLDGHLQARAAPPAARSSSTVSTCCTAGQGAERVSRPHQANLPEPYDAVNPRFSIRSVLAEPPGKYRHLVASRRTDRFGLHNSVQLPQPKPPTRYAHALQQPAAARSDGAGAHPATGFRRRRRVATEARRVSARRRRNVFSRCAKPLGVDTITIEASDLALVRYVSSAPTMVAARGDGGRADRGRRRRARLHPYFGTGRLAMPGCIRPEPQAAADLARGAPDQRNPPSGMRLPRPLPARRGASVSRSSGASRQLETRKSPVT